MKNKFIILDDFDCTPPEIARALHEVIMDRQPIQVKIQKMTVPIRNTGLVEDSLANSAD